jgi:hypothetical protein
MDNTLDAKKTSRRAFAKSLAATAGAIPLLTMVTGQGGCKSQKDDRPHIEQASPITIGGGSSVWIRFDSKYYKPVPGNPNRFVNNKKDTLHKWRMAKSLKPPEWKTVSNPKCRIVIHCIDPGGTPADSKVTILGSPMGIEFDDVKQFPFVDVPDLGKVWYSENRKIQGKIEFWLEGATNAEEEDVPASGICLIDLMDKLAG